MNIPHDPNCSYCTKPETLKAVMLEVAELPASTGVLMEGWPLPGTLCRGAQRPLLASCSRWNQRGGSNSWMR